MDATLVELVETLTFRAGYERAVVIAGTTLFGIAAGLAGVFALLRRRSMVADAIGHAALPGICVAFILATALGARGMSLPVLMAGAAASAVLGVLAIDAIRRRTRLPEDAAIGIVLSVFFGAGIVILSYLQRPGNAAGSPAGLDHFIFGQAAAMQVADVAVIGVVAFAVALAVFLFRKEFGLVCFNEGFASASGWKTRRIDLAILAMVLVVAVVGLQAVGLVLAVAMLVIPAVAARFWTERLGRMLGVAGLVGGLSGYAGGAASSLVDDVPTGPIVVLSAGVLLVISLLFAPRRGVIAAALGRARLRLRIAGDHLLELAHDLGTRTLDRAELRRVATVRGWPVWLRPLVVLALRRRGSVRRVGISRLELTEAGLRRGAEIARNHALWTQYLVSYADVAPSHVDWTVDQVEHVLAEEIVAELEARMRDKERAA